MLLFHADSMLATVRDIIKNVPDKGWPKVARDNAEITKIEIKNSIDITEMTMKNIAEIKEKEKISVTI